MQYQDYKHIIPIQIRFSDIDRLDHVNNACYHNYNELGRVTYFGEILKGHVQWDKQGFVLARTEINHILPVFLGDEVFCCTKIFKVGTKSISIKNAILRKEAGGLVACAEAIGILVAMDYIQNISIPVPDDWRMCIENYEK